MHTLLVPPPLRGGQWILPAEEAHHGHTVLRLRVGDEVRLADGKGREAEGTVLAIKPAMIVHAAEPSIMPVDPARDLIVILALPKGDLAAQAVRGLTEIGVGEICPLLSARVQGSQGTDVRRLERVMAEAVKQCRRSHMPSLGAALDVAGLAALAAADQARPCIVLDREGAVAEPGRPQPTMLIVGPEGGLTSEERRLLITAGARLVRLAGPILRIETAALAAAAVWAAAWEAYRP